MAEAILRARLADRAADVVVGSAGLYFDGRPAEPGAVKALARRGLDLAPFRSRIISAELLAGASLVLGMEQRHVREVSVLDPSLFARTFTLPEFAAAVAEAEPRGTASLADWVRELGRDRSVADHLGADPTLEVADPMGLSSRAFRTCADRLETLVDQIVEAAWPRVDASATPVRSPTPGGPR